MPATKNSKTSRRSAKSKDAGHYRPAFLPFTILIALGAAFAFFVYSQGWTVYWGDAEAHLNIARRVVDSRTPGYEQIGTVWLPVPHALMLPFVGVDSLWKTGLAAAIPGVLCFALAGTALFATSRRLFDSSAAAWCAALLLALNPNFLYLQSIPMGEAAFLASVSGLLYFTVVFAQTGSLLAVAAAGVCSAAASLTRYEGWFLIPFVGLFFLITAGPGRWTAAAIFAAIAGAAPLYWLAHNYYFHSNALVFYNGPWSAQAIYQRGHPPGSQPFPTHENWGKALQYYRTTVQWCSGTVLLWLAAAGIPFALWKRAIWPLSFLALIPAFYILSLHNAGSSGTEIFLPNLWPNNYYNTRYGIGTLPLLALAASALVAVLPHRVQGFAAAAIVMAVSLPWLVYPRPDNWITWKESKVNSDARRAYTAEAVSFFREHYRKGDGIFTSFSDLTGILRQSGIPLRASLHEGNGPEYLATLMRPDLFLNEEWALAIAADPVASAMMKVNTSYRVVRTIYAKGGPVVEIYRRIHDNPIPQGARRAQ
ncbi:MAG: glycosyltransferase family 39 protein [Bryobacteraceae bacterium]|nr:glycosyltransferase family 39 protein [Bryobacteraceae bacterium]